MGHQSSVLGSPLIVYSWGYTYAMCARIWTKFDSLTQNNMWITETTKIEIGSRIPIWRRFVFPKRNSYISATNWRMSTKFGLLIDFDVMNTAASTSRKAEVVLSRRGRHLEKSVWRHISALGGPILMKFGNIMQKLCGLRSCGQSQNQKKYFTMGTFVSAKRK